MYILRKDSPSKSDPAYKEAVEKWQNFLVGADFDEVKTDTGVKELVADGDFGEITRLATIEFQKRSGLTADGTVGNRTYGKAMELGFDTIDDDTPTTIKDANPNWPPQPTDLSSPGGDRRIAFFGKFDYVAAPRRGNPEAIKITDGWDRANIVKVSIPQLVGVNGAPHSGEVYFHEKVTPQVAALFKAWEEAGLMDNVLTWDGSFVPRFVRGGKVLSNHAFGSAFDINFSWNQLGKRPELVGRKGSVRELVPLANQHGFYWGGHYKKRPDGMHFEFAKF
jgi:hypothetical protein